MPADADRGLPLGILLEDLVILDAGIDGHAALVIYKVKRYRRQSKYVNTRVAHRKYHLVHIQFFCLYPWGMNFDKIQTIEWRQ